jgi:hypothetical protein
MLHCFLCLRTNPPCPSSSYSNPCPHGPRCQKRAGPTFYVTAEKKKPRFWTSSVSHSLRSFPCRIDRRLRLIIGHGVCAHLIYHAPVSPSHAVNRNARRPMRCGYEKLFVGDTQALHYLAIGSCCQGRQTKDACHPLAPVSAST